VIGLLAQAMTAEPIVPPRPNLGPEPMRAPGPGLAAVLGFLVAAIVLAGLLVWAVRRWRRSRARLLTPLEAAGSKRVLPKSPRIRLILFAELIRQALVKRFGPHWGAKTTEEIVVEPILAELLGLERKEELARILRVGDRAKFAWDLDDDAQGEDRESLVRAIVEEIGSAPGATSTINGKWSEPMSGPRRRSTTARSLDKNA
jgi:hypothetical protein